MRDRVARYLARHAELERWPLEAGDIEGIDHVVVIPAYDEEASLPRTLESLAHCDGADSALIMVVVNNAEDSPANVIEANARTLAALRSETMGEGLRLGVIDVSSQGREIMDEGGVGSARRIGMDHAVSLLRDNEHGVIISLDADTLVEPNYFSAVAETFFHDTIAGAVIEYEHPLPAPGAHRDAMVGYEVYLRHHAIALRWAGSPYGFHTIGSAFACTVSGYVDVSGMVRRAAGEDFYFLQKLAKAGAIGRVRDTIVYPSARAAARTPFGTGRHVVEVVAGDAEEQRLHAMENYAVLKRWLSLLERGWGADVDSVLTEAGEVSSVLAEFVVAFGIRKVWDGMQTHARDARAFSRRAHQWFDALAGLRLLHALRDAGAPDVSMAVGVRELVETLGEVSVGSSDGVAMLGRIRVIDRAHESPLGLWSK